MMTTAIRAAAILELAADTMKERDADYKGSDALYAQVMAVLFPEGIELVTIRDQHRFHIFMLMMVKVTRYVRNFKEGHADSLIDLAAYSGMLAALDQAQAKEPANQDGP